MRVIITSSEEQKEYTFKDVGLLRDFITSIIVNMDDKILIRVEKYED